MTDENPGSRVSVEPSVLRRLLSAAESWLKLAPIRGSEVTVAGWYLVSFGNGWSDGPWQFDGDLWHREPGVDSVEPDWAIPWGALPDIPKETTDG